MRRWRLPIVRGPSATSTGAAWKTGRRLPPSERLQRRQTAATDGLSGPRRAAAAHPPSAAEPAPAELERSRWRRRPAGRAQLPSGGSLRPPCPRPACAPPKRTKRIRVSPRERPARDRIRECFFRNHAPPPHRPTARWPGAQTSRRAWTRRSRVTPQVPALGPDHQQVLGADVGIPLDELAGLGDDAGLLLAPPGCSRRPSDSARAFASRLPPTRPVASNSTSARKVGGTHAARAR